MKRKKITYQILPDDDHKYTFKSWKRADEYINGFDVKPTIKSARKCAQKAANITGHPFMYYCRADVNKKRIIKRIFIVYPIESDCFLEML